MRRRISILLASALAAAGFVVLGPSQPAAAWEVCAANGVATVNPGLLYPITPTTPSKSPSLVFDVLIGQPNTPSAFGLDGIVCVHQGAPTNERATGVVKGYCGLSSGSGRFDEGDLFAWIGIGGTLVLTGHVIGVAQATPNLLTGQSCTHGTPTPLATAGALDFLVTGAAIKFNCSVNLQTLVPGSPDDTEILTQRTTTQHLNPVFHVLVDYGVHAYYNHQCVGNPVL